MARRRRHRRFGLGDEVVAQGGGSSHVGRNVALVGGGVVVLGIGVWLLTRKKTVSYTNSGTAPVGINKNGQLVPAGTAGSTTVPPGQTVTVSVGGSQTSTGTAAGAAGTAAGGAAALAKGLTGGPSTTPQGSNTNSNVASAFSSACDPCVASCPGNPPCGDSSENPTGYSSSVADSNPDDYSAGITTGTDTDAGYQPSASLTADSDTGYQPTASLVPDLSGLGLLRMAVQGAQPRTKHNVVSGLGRKFVPPGMYF